MDVLGQDRREGLGRKATSRFGQFFLILISVLLLLSSLYSAEASVFKKARESVVGAASPVLELLAGPIGYFNDVVGGVRDYFNVLEQNQALREENAELRQWMEEALELRTTVAIYETLQGYKAPPDTVPVDARVIGESNDVFTHSMLVNAGVKDGVSYGQAVVDDRGLIGRIVTAGGGASRVLLLTDVQSHIPVFIESADLEGILSGTMLARPVINVTERTAGNRVEPGQRILTSGAGGVMPRGLPVGVVRRIKTRDSETEIVIDLYANYSRTRMVRVINFSFPVVDEIEELSEPGEEASAPAPVAPQPAVAATPVSANAPTVNEVANDAADGGPDG